MIRYLLVFSFLLCAVGARAQVIRQQINQNFSAVGVDSVVFELGPNVVWRKSPGTRILIEISIEQENGTPAVMSVLSRSNRYKLLTELNHGILTITFPKNNPTVRVGDKVTSEKLTFKVYMPRSLWDKMPEKSRL